MGSANGGGRHRWCDRDGPGDAACQREQLPVVVADWLDGGSCGDLRSRLAPTVRAIATLLADIPRGHAALLAIRATVSEIC